MKLHIPNYYTLRTEGITQSLLVKYMRCPRSFLIAVNGYQEKSRMTAQTGSLGRALLQAYRDGKSWERRLANYEFETWTPAKEREIMRSVMKAIIPAYIEYWSKYHTPWKSIKAEKLFDVRIGQYRLRGKRDGVFKTYLGRTGILETKFKSQIGAKTIENLNDTLSIDYQSLFYVLATYLETQKYPAGVIYDVVRYPARTKGDVAPAELFKKLTKAIEKDPDNYFYRWQTPFKAKEIEAFRLETIQKLDEIDGRSVWYRNECACLTPFRCPYIRFCITGRPEGLKSGSLFSELEDDEET